MKPLPCVDEGFLSHIFGHAEITQHGIRATESHVLKARDQPAESLMSFRERVARVNGFVYQALYVLHLESIL